MDWKDIVAKVTSAAPLVGSLFGPAGIIIGSGIKLLAGVLGVEPTQEAVMAEIASNPDALLKLKELEANNRVELEKLSIEWMRIEYADMQSARDRETKVVQATGGKDYNLYILAWTIVFGFFALMALLLKLTIPPDQNGVIFMLFGALASGFSQVLSYFFGSSKSSELKTDMIYNSSPALPKKAL